MQGFDNAHQQARLYAQLSDSQFRRGLHLMELAGLVPGATVLDIGCGPGLLTRELARQVGASGRVIALDPDGERLELARALTAVEFPNITYYETGAERLPMIADASVDFAYSNYVFHWIQDKDSALAEVRRALRTGGCFVCKCVPMLADRIIEISTLAGEHGRQLLSRFHYLSCEEWELLLKRHQLSIEHLERLEAPYEFRDLDHFFSWWEGTAHGAFRREYLPDAALADLKRRYPEKVVFTGPAIVIKARKLSA